MGIHPSFPTRRQVLGAAAAGLVVASLPKVLFAAGKAIPLAVQLYSVRDDCAKDFDPALTELAKMGFAAVEFAGYHKYNGKAKELRAKLDELNLKVAGTHIGTGSIKPDQIQKTIDFHQTIGCNYLIVPGDGGFTDPEKSKALAETFNKAAETLKPLGMGCGYHNHTGEFKKVDGTTYWHLFAQRTSKDVILEQDCGWTVAAGLNPVDLMKEFPGRMKVTHLKPVVMGKGAGKKPVIGQDSADWPAIVTACRDIGGTEWYIVEQENYFDGKSPMQCTQESLEGLKKIIATLA
jgi:sugar phosphate isomerase/epimerase